MKRKFAAIAAVLLAGTVVSQSALAQVYNDPVRLTFATQGCNEGKWETKGYETFLDCFHAYYNAYPNDPNPDPEA